MRSLRVLVTLFSVLGLLAGSAVMVGASHTQDRDDLDQHCPDHQGHPNKVENPAPGSVRSTTVDGTDVFLHFSDDLHSVEFFADEAGTTPITVEFCLKAGNRAGGKEIGHEGHVSWQNRGGPRPQISHAVVYRIVEPPDECPAALVLSPDAATNELGESHTVTATVTDPDGTACDGVAVRFEVAPGAGAVPPSGTATTDASGQASFSYTRNHESSDTITACTSDDGQAPASCDQAGVTIKGTATKTWVEPPEGFWTCEARVVELLGLEPFGANVDEVECMDDEDELLSLPLGGDEDNPAVLVELARAETMLTDSGPSSRAIVTGAEIRDPDGGFLVGAHVLQSEAWGECQAGEPVLDSRSSVGTVYLLDEDPLLDVSEPTSIDALDDLVGTIHLNHTTTEADGDNARRRQRALWWESFPLGDIVVAEATADHHGNPCE